MMKAQQSKPNRCILRRAAAAQSLHPTPAARPPRTQGFAHEEESMKSFLAAVPSPLRFPVPSARSNRSSSSSATSWPRHAEGPCAEFSRRRRGAHQGPRQDRDLSQQPALQGCRGAGSAAARAPSRCSPRQSPNSDRWVFANSRYSTCRTLRQLRRRAQGDERSDRGRALHGQARGKGNYRPRLLGQRFQADVGEQAHCTSPRTRRASRCASSRRKCSTHRCGRSARSRR